MDSLQLDACYDGMFLKPLVAFSTLLLKPVLAYQYKYLDHALDQKSLAIDILDADKQKFEQTELLCHSKIHLNKKVFHF